MKSIFSALLIFSFGLSAHATSVQITEAQATAALEKLAPQTSRPERVGRLLAKIGIGGIATGGVLVVVGHHLVTSAPGWTNFANLIVGGTLRSGGVAVVASGTVVAVIGAGLIVLSPSTAHAGDLQDYYLMDKAHLAEFLGLPLEKQKNLLSVSPRLTALIVGLADNLTEEL